VTLLDRNSLEAAIKDVDLERRMVVMPLLDEATQIGPASVDVRLGTRFRILRRTANAGLDPGSVTQAELEAGQYKVTVAFGEPLWLHPGQLALGSTLEFLRFPAHLGAYVMGRSSWGRAGLLVATAVMVQPGFSGSLTLELVNHGESPIALFAGARVAQLAIHDLRQATSQPYHGKYSSPTGPEVSRLDLEVREIERLKQLGRDLSTKTL
jgi:dCTP deaminase